MNRFKAPSCSRCKSNYHVGDNYGQKIPMLLNCGHDMCKNCLKFLLKKNKQVICEICQADTMIKCEYDISNAPIHYYLVGKVLSLSFNKNKGLYRDIENLKMKSLNIESLHNIKKNCYLCHKNAVFYCHQCSVMYCESCSQEVHKMNQILSQHELERIHFTDTEFPLELNCDQHSKLIEFICMTCDVQMCSICTVENHKYHDTENLEKYYMSEVQRLNECTNKGEILLKKLKLHRNNFNKKVKNCQNAQKKKNNDYDIKKQIVSTFVSSVIGALQRLEYKFLNMFDEADQAINNSTFKIMSQLDNIIEDLQEKLNQIDSLFKKKQYSCIKMLPSTINDIERILDTTYYIAKKNEIETPILLNNNIFETINQCIVSKIDPSDSYILTNSPVLPLNYVLTSTIEVTNNALSERTSSVSSCISTTSSDISTPDVIYPSKLGYSSIKEIFQNVTELVVITCMNSPSDFYVQLLANNEIMTMIANELDNFVKTEQSIVGIIRMDNVMYAIQASDDRWYRGFVVQIKNNEGPECLYRVYCIDYGFIDFLKADRIRNVPASVVSIPPLAYNCALYDLKPSSITGWSNEAYKLFTKLISEKNGIYCIHPMDLSGEQIKVDLIWKDCIYPLSIRDAMFFLGHGSSAENFVNKELHEELINLISLPSNIQLKKEKEYPVVISHLISPYEFYMRIMNDETTISLEETMATLESIYKPTEGHMHKSYLLYTPQIGMVVAARYSIDSNWYRAKITSLPEPRMVTVFYIDYGNSETLPWDQLRVLDKSLIKIPPLAVKASLTDIEPAVDGIECDKWSSLSCAAFMNLIETDYVQENLSAIVQNIDFDTHRVVLFSRTSRGEICINSQLLNLGHATTFHPTLCVFNKKNTRSISTKSSLYINSREKIKINTSDDTLAFVKKRSVIESENHWWSNKENKKKPGIQMSVVKIVSPDEMTLKYINYNTADLTERMNKVYSKNMNINTLKWYKNDLCAAFIQKFGNWYRGKIVEFDTKKTTTIYFYDLDETYQVPLKDLAILKRHFVDEKCGILHCSMNNLIPLGVSDGKWSKFSCDRLIEELKKYPDVYLKKCGKRGNIVLGEIWVRDVNSPQALEPLNERWLNMNKFMVEQGFALSKKQASQGDENITTLSEIEFNNTFETLKNDSSINSWLPPIPISISKFNATGTYVDNGGQIYFQCSDNDIPQLLQNVKDELNFMFMNSEPEPINFKWSNGQMVIVKYHLDNLWYRGIILEVKKDDLFSVQFIDYGNTEDCSRDNLRSTLYMTDIPQLCVKGFLYNLIPVTKNNKWSSSTLDFIHYLVVDKHLEMTIDLETSNGNVYAIKSLKSNGQPDICQYLVSNNHAYLTCVDKSTLQFFEDPTSHDTTESYDSTENNDTLSEHSTLRFKEYYNCNENCSNSMLSSYRNSIDHEEINNMVLQNDNTDSELKVVGSREISFINTYNYNTHVNLEENDKKNESNYYKNKLDYESDIDETKEEEEDSYSKFCLELGDELEGTLSTVIEPTRMTLMITKIGGVCLSKSKDEMHHIMFEKCPKLPVINQITSGTAVVVLHNVLWRRGLIVDDGRSVLLVDLGVTVKLNKNNVKLCPKEFFHLPMLSIDCQLENIKISEKANPKDIIKTMSNLLRGIKLKIVGRDKLDEDILSVELYNDNGEIAYQPLIDNKLLIPKN